MRARKRFGQHFLEPQWIRKVVDAIGPAAEQTFLEIGPGRGALTLGLAASGARIVAVEIDRDLAAELRAVAPLNVEVVASDFLRTDIVTLIAGFRQPGTVDAADNKTPVVKGQAKPVRVVGNLPYNISSPILFRLIALQLEGSLFSDATLLLQQEVASRLLARPATADYGTLAICVQLHADVSRLLTLPPGAFRPRPRVTSTLVRLVFRPPAVPLADPQLFEALVRTLFQRRRKTVLNALRPFADIMGLSADAALSQLRLDPRRRPETLELSELARLADVFAATRPPVVL